MGVQPGKITSDPLNYIALGKQSAKGTEGDTFYFPRYLSGSGFEVQRDVQREKEGGDGLEVGLSYVSMVKADGAFVANARPEYEARIFAAAQGNDTVGTAAATALTRHTAFPVATPGPYFTVEQRWNDEVERTVDCVFTGFDLEGEAGKPWKVTGNFISGGTVYQRDIGSALTPTLEGGKPHMFAFGSYTFDGGASYAADVTKFKISQSNGVDDAIQTTSLGRDDVTKLSLDVTADVTVKYTSRAFYQKVQYRGGSTVLSELATGSIDLAQLQQVPISSGVSATGLARVVLPLIEWTDAKVNKLDPDGKTVYLDLVGNSVKGATVPIFTQVDTLATEAY